MTLTTDWPFGHLSQDSASKAQKLIASVDLSPYTSDPHLQREFRRFLLVRQMLGRPISMQSSKVDEVWHQFILDTQNYMDFCEEVFGEYLHHKPGTIPVDPVFPELYRAVFGEALPSVWTSDYVHTDGRQVIGGYAMCGDCA